MEIRICDVCGSHNESSAWSCRVCGKTLSIDSLCEIDDEQVNFGDSGAEVNVEPDFERQISLLETPSLKELEERDLRKKEAQRELEHAEELKEKRMELVNAVIRWKSWDDGFGTQARIIGDLEHAGPMGIEVLMDLLVDDRFSSKADVIEILNRMKSREAVDPLIGLYSEADTDLKKGILGILINTIMGHGGGLGPLYSPDKESPAWPKSKKILLIETFIRAYKDDDPSVRNIAAVGIMRNMEHWVRFEYDFSELLDGLIANTTNESEDMRRAAVKSLGYSKDQRAIKVLNKALEDEKGSIRRAAKKAIKRLEKDLNLS